MEVDVWAFSFPLVFVVIRNVCVVCVYLCLCIHGYVHIHTLETDSHFLMLCKRSEVEKRKVNEREVRQSSVISERAGT